VFENWERTLIWLETGATSSSQTRDPTSGRMRFVLFFSSLELKAESSSELFWSPFVHRPSVNFYIFAIFSRTTEPILTRLGTNHSWGKGIQVSSNDGDSLSPRGDNRERVKIHWKILKVFFSRTSRPNWIKLGTNYPWMKGIQVCSN
jgi:hypothetical protein